ncbi:Maf family protein [uncultured Megamonas sp.]|uniref:Maf family protein n=1 Tax=uncultured Megamonas sp. TaxID=286140 RepID=UPI0025F40419|nr:Maf family protein [uncultured Megamonas sp.]
MLILASASPRRKELLEQIHCKFLCRPSSCDELTAIDEPNPQKLVIQNAILKAKASVDKNNPNEVILGSDTVVALNNTIYGKPRDDQEAFSMLKNLSGKTHQVCTGIALIKNGQIFSDVCITDVTMKSLSDEEILNYIQTKEPQDKAGAYAIQGLASIFIEKINGCYFNVVGLPLNCLYNLCKKADVDL